MSPPRRRRRRWMAIVALGIGCMFAVVALEVFLRVADPIGRHYHDDFALFLGRALRFHWDGAPPPGTPGGLDLDGRLFELKPDLDVSIGSFRLRTNAQGARGPALALPKPDDVFRIVVLGDSVAFGWGVDDEVTFLRRLEQEWRPASGGKRLEVVNLGLPHYDTHQELASLRETGLPLQPDLVLLIYVVNDIQPTRDLIAGLLTGTPVVDEFLARVPEDFCSSMAMRLVGVLPATAALIGTFTDLDARVRRALPPGETYAPERYGRGVAGWPRSQQALLTIRDLCRTNGLPLLLLDHTQPAVEALPGFCREQAIDYADFRFDAEEKQRRLALSRIDSHCNRLGHELLLQKLRRILGERRLLPAGG
ncbi:MAG: SGNH/GDSL hydrolase family protein [Planctomycetes bacterium]|nr:SGNH/GDSL hydrolase family protein [Planctomycetota bacterium]